MSVTYTDIYLIKMHFSVISVISSHPSISLFIWYLFVIRYLVFYVRLLQYWGQFFDMVIWVLYLSSSPPLILILTLTVMIFPTWHSRLDTIPHPPSMVTLFGRIIAHTTDMLHVIKMSDSRSVAVAVRVYHWLYSKDGKTFPQIHSSAIAHAFLNPSTLKLNVSASWLPEWIDRWVILLADSPNGLIDEWVG